MKKSWLLVFLIFVFPFTVFAEELTVAVAANVQYPFEEIKTAFEKHSGVTIKPVLGSSGKFVTQIENGAPFDIFLSADMDYPQTLAKKGFTCGAPKVYGYGTLVLWTLKDIDLSKGLAIIADPAIKKFAIANPDISPYGKQAIIAMSRASALDWPNDAKFVYGESIAQVNQFIASLAADVGVTAKSVVLAPNMTDKGKWVEIDKNTYEPIAQGVVVLKYGKENHPVAAQEFFDFLFTQEARKILENYGYILP